MSTTTIRRVTRKRRDRGDQDNSKSKDSIVKGLDEKLFNELLKESETYDNLIVEKENAVKYDWNYIWNLQKAHAIKHNKYRDFVITSCPQCKTRYQNFKYFAFMVQREVPVDIAISVMNYDKNDNTQVLECCLKFAATFKVDMKFEDNFIKDIAKLKVSFLMCRGWKKEDILVKCEITEEEFEEILKNYEVPPIDQEISNLLERWENDSTVEVKNLVIKRNEMDNLEIERDIKYLKYCTSCGTPVTYPFLYWLLTTLFDINREEFFLDFQVFAPCCRMSYMTPIMKPIPPVINREELGKITHRFRIREGDKAFELKGKGAKAVPEKRVVPVKPKRGRVPRKLEIGKR